MEVGTVYGMKGMSQLKEFCSVGSSHTSSQFTIIVGGPMSDFSGPYCSSLQEGSLSWGNPLCSSN